MKIPNKAVTHDKIPCGIFGILCYSFKCAALLKHSLIGSRQGLNPGPFNLKSPGLPSELPCIGQELNVRIIVIQYVHVLSFKVLAYVPMKMTKNYFAQKS